MTDDSSLTRRRLLQSGAAVGTLALAGCGTLGGSDGEQTTTGRPTATPTETATATATPDPETPTALLAERVDDGTVALMLERVLQRSRLAERSSSEDTAFVIARFAAKNLTDDWFMPGQVFDSFALAAGGEEYGRVPVPNVRFSQFNGGFVAPGEVVRGFLAFEAPTDVSAPAMAVELDHERLTLRRPTFRMDARAESVTPLAQSLGVPVRSVGETVTDGAFAAAVTDYRTTRSVGPVQAPEGSTFVIPTVEIRNDTGEDVVVNVVTQALLKNGAGGFYNTSLQAHDGLNDPLRWTQTVAGNGRHSGPVPYVAGESAGQLQLEFDFAGLDGETRAFWALE